MTELAQALIFGISIGLLYSLIGVGFVLIYKATHVFNLAQGELLLFGTFICWSLLNLLGLSPVLAVIISLVLAALLGMVLNRLFIAPLIGQPLISILMITIVLGLLLRGAAYGLWLGPPRALGISLGDTLHLGDIIISQHYILSLVVAIVVFGLLALFFRTKPGLAMRATADDHQAAQATGVAVVGVFNQVWIGAAVLATMGGIMLGVAQPIHTEFYLLGYKAFPVVILGGLDSVTGVLIAGPIVGILEYLAMLYLDPIVGGGAGEIMPYIILLLALLVKPYGLMGSATIERI